MSDKEDAVRYRWLRDECYLNWSPATDKQRMLPGPMIDAAIDAAIGSPVSALGSPAALATGKVTTQDSSAPHPETPTREELIALLTEARKWMDGDVMNDPWEKAFCEKIDAMLAAATGR